MITTDTRCTACGYSLLGLAPAGLCPECAAPIAESLRPSAFGFLSDADAKRLYRGVKRLAGSLACVMLGALVSFGITAGELPFLVAGFVLVAVGALRWVMGWAAVAGVRAPGASGRARRAVRVLRFAVWGQLASMAASVVEVQMDWDFLGGGILLMPSLAVGFFLLVLAAGQASVFALVRASRLDQLQRDARVLSHMVAWFIGLAVFAFILLAAVPVLGGFVAMLAGLLGLGLVAAWWGFLSSLADVLQARITGSGVGPRGSAHG